MFTFLLNTLSASVPSCIAAESSAPTSSANTLIGVRQSVMHKVSKILSIRFFIFCYLRFAISNYTFFFFSTMYKIKPRLPSSATPATEPIATKAGEAAGSDMFPSDMFPKPAGTATSATAFTPVSFSPIHQLPFSPINGVRPSLPSAPTTLPRLTTSPSV